MSVKISSLYERKKRAVFLDRDGTLNAPMIKEGKPYPPAKLCDFILLPGVVDG